MITFRLPAAALAAGLTLAQAAPSGQAPPAKPALGTFGIDTAQMDTAVKPGDDFFRYVNGKWLATATIPADKARYGMFDALRDKAEADVRTLVDELGTDAGAGRHGPPEGRRPLRVAGWTRRGSRRAGSSRCAPTSRRSTRRRRRPT